MSQQRSLAPLLFIVLGTLMLVMIWSVQNPAPHDNAGAGALSSGAPTICNGILHSVPTSSGSITECDPATVSPSAPRGALPVSPPARNVTICCPGAKVHTVVARDTLWHISAVLLGNPTKWRQLRLEHPGPHETFTSGPLPDPRQLPLGAIIGTQ